MRQEERMGLILEELAADGSVGVAEIAAKLGVSTASIRRDLQLLEKQRLLSRTHGGAVANSTAYELPLRYRGGRHRDEKRRIAAAAAARVGDDVASAQRPNCTFCQRSEVADILEETPHFLLAADHAPLVEGHLLVIPKDHYACYGDTPTTLDEELFAIKDELRQFYTQHYAPVVFWEHGVFRQTVFHAHLHCFPWGNLSYDLESRRPQLPL